MPTFKKKLTVRGSGLSRFPTREGRNGGKEDSERKGQNVSGMFSVLTEAQQHQRQHHRSSSRLWEGVGSGWDAVGSHWHSTEYCDKCVVYRGVHRGIEGNRWDTMAYRGKRGESVKYSGKSVGYGGVFSTTG